MGEVHPLFSATFDPGANRAMGLAFESAWQSLKESGSVYAADYRAASSRNLMARKILELARCGERNPARLRAAALDAVIGSVHPARSKQ
jgi:hypothetical protein